MKKYVKPELFLEQFELSQHIADCAWELKFASGNSCYAEPDSALLPGLPNLFTISTNGCVATEDKLEEFCYTVATAGANTIMS